MSKSYDRPYSPEEFEAIKASPRETTQEEYVLLACYEWNKRYRRHIPGTLLIPIHHLVTRSHVSYIRNGKPSPWNPDYTFRAPDEPKMMPLAPDTMPAPDELATMPGTVKGPKREGIARQILGLFWEGKPLQVHVIIRKMGGIGIEEDVVRNVVSALRVGGLLANPEKGIYTRADPSTTPPEPADA